MAYRWLENLRFVRTGEAGKWVVVEGVGYTTYSEGGFFDFDVELEERDRDRIIDYFSRHSDRLPDGATAVYEY